MCIRDSISTMRATHDRPHFRIDSVWVDAQQYAVSRVDVVMESGN